MRQLDPDAATPMALPDGEPEDVVGGAVVERAVAVEVGQLEDGAQAVVVGGAGGEEAAFGDAGDVPVLLLGRGGGV